MEFIQFHPTSLFHPDAKSFLISEAVRGEGGILRRKDGTAFMAEYDPERKDLAPRDIVARAIDSEIKKTGDECVYLDVTHLAPEEIKAHFPTIYARCLSFGIDITTDWIPVVPAAHYSCGGVRTDLTGPNDHRPACTPAARSPAPAFTARTGWPPTPCWKRWSSASAPRKTPWNAADLPAPCESVPDFPGTARRVGALDHALVAALRHRLQTVMQKYVGIVRSNSRLQKATAAVQALRTEAQPLFDDHVLADDVLELRNMIEVAGLIIQCAQKRKESRGLHYTTDYPQAVESERHDTILKRTLS